MSDEYEFKVVEVDDQTVRVEVCGPCWTGGSIEQIVLISSQQAAEGHWRALLDRINGAIPAAEPRPLPSGITEEMVACWDGDDLWCWLHLLPEGTECRNWLGSTEWRKTGAFYSHRPVLVSAPQEPETEWVRLHDLKGRCLDGYPSHPVTSIRTGGLGWWAKLAEFPNEVEIALDANGMVEVLREGDR